MSDSCALEAAPVLHSCDNEKRGTKVPGDVSAQNRKKKGPRMRNEGRGSLGGARWPKRWRFLKSYRKVNKSLGEDASSWMAYTLPFPLDMVHHQ